MSIGSTAGIVEQQRPPVPPSIAGKAYSYENTTPTNAYTPTMPGSIVAGELLLCIAMCYYNGSSQTLSTATSGWTKRYQYGSTSNDSYIGIFTKKAVGSDTAPTIDFTQTVVWKVMVYRLENAATDDVINPILHHRTSYFKPTSTNLQAFFPHRVTEPYTLDFAVSMGSNVAMGPITLNTAKGYTIEDSGEEGAGNQLAFAVATKAGDKTIPENFMAEPPFFKYAVTSNYYYNGVTFSVRGKTPPTPGQTNLIYHSNDIRNIYIGQSYDGWGSSNNSSYPATFDQVGFDGVANSATRLKDNSSSLYSHPYPFLLNDVYCNDMYTAKFWLKKEDPREHASVPAFQVRSWQSYSSYTGNAWLKVDQRDGTYQAGATPTDTVFDVQEYTDGVGQVWYGVIIQTPKINTGSRNVLRLDIYPGYASTIASGSSSSLWGNVTIGNVELYERCYATDVANNPPVIRPRRGPANPSGYRVWMRPEGSTGVDLVDDTGNNYPQIGPRPLWAQGSAVFFDTLNRVYSNNNGHWPWYDAGVSDVTVRTVSDVHYQTAGYGFPTCRGGGPGNINAYAARVVNMNGADPVLEIWRCAAGAWAVVASTQTTMTGEGPLRHVEVEMKISSDSAGVYAEATPVGGSTYNSTHLTTEWNTNTYCGFYLRGDSGNYYPRLREFDVKDYP